jgi:hypothetical protein
MSECVFHRGNCHRGTRGCVLGGIGRRSIYSCGFDSNQSSRSLLCLASLPALSRGESELIWNGRAQLSSRWQQRVWRTPSGLMCTFARERERENVCVWCAFGASQLLISADYLWSESLDWFVTLPNQSLKVLIFNPSYGQMQLVDVSACYSNFIIGQFFPLRNNWHRDKSYCFFYCLQQISNGGCL